MTKRVSQYERGVPRRPRTRIASIAPREPGPCPAVAPGSTVMPRSIVMPRPFALPWPRDAPPPCGRVTDITRPRRGRTDLSQRTMRNEVDDAPDTGIDTGRGGRDLHDRSD